ncbi:MAG: DNA repair protein RadA [Peptococcaceae bacterium]|nr:DNA repair protein RadA [Peptococcaceae bacterium]
MSAKTRFACTECGYISVRWLGRCTDCGGWNTLVEETINSKVAFADKNKSLTACPISNISIEHQSRFTTGIHELDGALGGGVVPGSLVLLGGDPGIGKSTLLLQMASELSRSGRKVLYVSGEESVQQIKMRSIRLNVEENLLFLLAETDIDQIEANIRETSPELVIIDSIQVVIKAEISASPGGVGQVRECASQMMRLAKMNGPAIFLVGHITKEGALAGPKVLEHMVDTVLYFEGERNNSFRILRSVKNRFGSTNEIGIFQMEGDGLKEVANPSEMFLSNRHSGDVPGSVVVSTIEGNRPLLVEVQALVCTSSFGSPRRMTAGVDYNRVSLILAVLEKRVGLHIGGQDAYVNAVGGVRLDEPAADLGIALALASSFKEVSVVGGLVAFGEIGLTGEIRPVPNLEKRINEAARLGFSRCIIPKSLSNYDPGNNMKVIRMNTLQEAIGAALV